MRLYLVQHGIAKNKEEDPERPLAAPGREETELMAEMAAKLDLGIDEIRHSGKIRAEQTAAIFGRALQLTGNVVQADGLGPVDDVGPVAAEMAEETRDIMLVGHLPFMPRLTGFLVNGDQDDSPVAFRNSGVVCLTRENGDWRVLWQILPG